MSDDKRERVIKANLEVVGSYRPQSVFRFFADVSAVPRESGDIARCADFLEKFAEEHNLQCSRDETDNIVISKPGTKSSSCSGVILQAHQDMVCVKVKDSAHDFTKDPIEFVDAGDGFLRADGTSLGGDDGIGGALALAVLASSGIPHPPLKALFTVDEETDMKGAEAVTVDFLYDPNDKDDFCCDTLINLDAEDLNIAYVSSAAGVGFTLTLPLEREDLAQAPQTMRLVSVEGLTGGHSGLEINKGGANAYVLLARFLAAASQCALFSFSQEEGHGADNAIPDRAFALVGLNSEDDAKKLDAAAAAWTETFKNEFRVSDPDARVRCAATPTPQKQKPLKPASKNALLNVVRMLPLGVFRFIQSKELSTIKYDDLLVETSCNLGTVAMGDDQVLMRFMARGSTESVLDDYMGRIAALAETTGCVLDVHNRTAGWEMAAESTRVQSLFQKQGLDLLGVHAGLECGCLVQTFRAAGKKLDAISVGPDLKDVHSPNERLKINTVEPLWNQLLAVLKEL